MFKLNLKIALRSLLKNKIYTSINVLGLALGLTAAVLLLLFANHEASYDKWDSQLKNVYQVREYHDISSEDNQQHWQEFSESRIAHFVQHQIPQFKYVTKANRGWETGFSLKVDDKHPIMVKDIVEADSSFFKVFPYKFIAGNPLKAINSPNTIVLKEHIAVLLFGRVDVVGKEIKIVRYHSDEGRIFTVSGVIEDTKTPESLAINAITHSGKLDVEPTSENSNYVNIYVNSGSVLDTTLLNKTLQKVYIEYRNDFLTTRGETYEGYYKDGNRVPGLKIIPLEEVHSKPSNGNNWLDKIKPIGMLSVFLLVISMINFINLATAQSVQRAKEVGVKKVLGAYRKELIGQFLIESAIQTFSALFLTVISVELLLKTFNTHFDVQLSFWSNSQIISIGIQLCVLFFVITLLSGFYPALILSNYNPIKVLKGNYENGVSGLFLKNGLIVFQFVIAITLMIGVGVMYAQNEFINQKDLGFNKDQLINITSNYDDEDPFFNSLKRISGIKYIATTSQVMGGTYNSPLEVKFKDQKLNLNAVTVSMDALPALGVKVLEGRLFGAAYGQDSINTVILNQAAANLLGNHTIGKTFTGGKENDVFQVVGVIQDYHNQGFDKLVIPTLYRVTRLYGSVNTSNLLVRFDHAHYQSTIKKIEEAWEKVYPNYPIQYASIEDAVRQELEPHYRMMRVVLLFSVISVLLSLLGLFALSTFMAKRRTKEVAIRKILGASNIELIQLLNKSFVMLVFAANLISWPIAYIFTNNWLSGFAYRIMMPIWPFVIATFASIIVALFTVSLQARKAAASSPVDSLKYE